MAGANMFTPKRQCPNDISWWPLSVKCLIANTLFSHANSLLPMQMCGLRENRGTPAIELLDQLFVLYLHVRIVFYPHRCAEPLEYRGTPAVELLDHPKSFVCHNPHSSPEHHAVFGPLSVAIILVGALLLFTGSLIFAYVLFRRSKSRQMFGDTIKYRRAQNDEEAAPS
ncbi:hypothetical protein SK128_022614 [Halocaridina rubra]|uniref:Uncharacterized protein n=1 Tax=Halocaridina rubra TaxID=373956 RepID=A0AAN8WW61_HALRR